MKLVCAIFSVWSCRTACIVYLNNLAMYMSVQPCREFYKTPGSASVLPQVTETLYIIFANRSQTAGFPARSLLPFASVVVCMFMALIVDSWCRL
jgi:hypothetical protein